MPTDVNCDTDSLLVEYEFDYRNAKPNRFVLSEQQRVVILEPDVANYFHDSEAVDRALRAILKVMYQRRSITQIDEQ